MCSMNERAITVKLRDFMKSQEGWGREQGRGVYQRLLEYVETNPGVLVYRVSLAGVKRVDISFASETIVELAFRFRGKKGFCLIDPMDPDMLENWEAAAERKNQPIIVWQKDGGHVIGPQPSKGNIGAFLFAMTRPRTRANEFVKETPGISISNASMKFKQLWERGFLLRREELAETGGVEYSYYRIG